MISDEGDDYTGLTLLSLDGCVVLHYNPQDWTCFISVDNSATEMHRFARSRVSIEQVREIVEGGGLVGEIFDRREWRDWHARVRATLLVPSSPPVDKSPAGGP